MSGRAALRHENSDERQPLSAGEAGFLWWFIQGSIMEPDVRDRLRDAWGMCPRHTFAYLSAEAAFRHRFMHGPAILYADLTTRAVSAFGARRIATRGSRLARELRARGPCHMCELGYDATSAGFIRPDRLRVARDSEPLVRFMNETRVHWVRWLCGRCAGTGNESRCRPHLLDDIDAGLPLELTKQRGMLEEIAAHLARYERSFMWDHRGTEGPPDRAALVAAAGWCSGWRLLLAALGD